jgi:hypothetical protein
MNAIHALSQLSYDPAGEDSAPLGDELPDDKRFLCSAVMTRSAPFPKPPS